MLAIRFHFLYPHFYAKDVRDPDRVEWPPHPDRVYAALVNAAYATLEPERFRPLLHWLASLDPPGIAAPEAHPWNGHTLFVPVKIQPAAAGDFYLKAAKPENSVSLGRLDLTYLWPAAAPTPEQCGLLRELLGHVGYLASPRNMATGELAEDPGAPDFVPAPDGDYTLRVPHPQRLEALEKQHRLRVEEGRVNYVDPGVFWAGYRRALRPADGPRLTNAFIRVALFRFPDAPELIHTRELAEALRNRLVACASDQLGHVPNWIHGHADPGQRFVPHVALAPRAAVNQERADGRLAGLALLLPVTATYHQDRTLIAQVLTHPDLQEFALGPTRVFLQLHETRQLRATREAPYTEPSRLWATVSPVMIDRFPTRHESLESILSLMLEREGFPLRDADIRYHAEAFVAGVPPVFQFRHRHSNYHKRPSFHMRLELAQPVPGPVTLGTTRYLGLGHFIGLPAGVPA